MKTLFYLLIFLPVFCYSQYTLNVGSGSNIVSNSYLVLDNTNFIVNGTITMNDTIMIHNGNFELNGTFNSGTSTFKFYNDTTHDHYITATTTCEFYNLFIQGNVTSPYDLHLNSDIRVYNHLSLQSQKINLDNHGIDLGTTGQLFNEQDNQKLYDSNGDVGTGYIKRTAVINAFTTVDPGNLGLELTTHANSMGSTVITRYHKNVDIGSGLYGIDRYFDIVPTYNGVNYGGNLNVDLKFKFFTDIIGSVSDLSSLKVYRSSDGVTWENKGGTVDLINNIVTVDAIEHFSNITIAPDNGALPIELLYFTGFRHTGYNTINWATASEFNTAYFELQVSQTGTSWLLVSNIPAANNSNIKILYSTIDSSPASTINYYQLVQHDIDGNYKVYGPIILDNTYDTRRVLHVFNLLGKEAMPNETGLLIEVYDDGTTKKIIR